MGTVCWVSMGACSGERSSSNCAAPRMCYSIHIMSQFIMYSFMILLTHAEEYPILRHYQCRSLFIRCHVSCLIELGTVVASRSISLRTISEHRSRPTGKPAYLGNVFISMDCVLCKDGESRCRRNINSGLFFFSLFQASPLKRSAIAQPWSFHSRCI